MQTGNISDSNQEYFTMEVCSQQHLWHTYFSVIGALRKTDSMSRIRECKFLLMLFCWSQNLRNSALSFFRASTTPAQWHSRRSLWSISSTDKKRSFTTWSWLPLNCGLYTTTSQPIIRSSGKINRGRSQSG